MLPGGRSGPCDSRRDLDRKEPLSGLGARARTTTGGSRRLYPVKVMQHMAEMGMGGYVRRIEVVVRRRLVSASPDAPVSRSAQPDVGLTPVGEPVLYVVDRDGFYTPKGIKKAIRDGKVSASSRRSD